MAGEEDVLRVALALPGARQDPNGFRFLVNDKLFAWSYMERVEPKKPRVRRPDVLVVRVADEWDKQGLLSEDPDKFFTTSHYDGYSAILVRLPAVDAVELEGLLIDAWRTRAPRALVAEFDRRCKP
jgi:hypothetical protein